MIYLASPYSHPEPAVRKARFEAACRATARMLEAGLNVFSPIVHGHPLASHGLRGDWSYWSRFAREQLCRCDEVVVLTLNGWRESVGVQAEVRIAGAYGKPVRYLARSPEIRATRAQRRRRMPTTSKPAV